jgi:hypothetical protein
MQSEIPQSTPNQPSATPPSLSFFSSFVLRGGLGGPRPAESLLDRFLSLVDLITVHKTLTGLPAGVSARCAEPLAEAFVADPGDDTPFSILAFPKAGLALGLEMERYPHVDWTSPKIDDGTTQRATMAIKDVEKGRLRSAVRRLAGTAAVATVDNEVSQLSRTSAPGGGRRPVCPAQGRVSGDIPSEEEIAAALKIFKPDTSPCLSQWIPSSWPPLYGCRRSSHPD